RRKLKIRGINQDIIDETISLLTRDGLLSNERFTESYVRVRINKGFGPLRIRAELGELGIDDEMVAQYVVQDEEFWFESAMVARSKRFGEDKPEDTKAWSKQARFLQQRGFNTSMVRKILGNCYG
ncbi:MAG: recombination regulator RecX, partial [Gammaproteobacteria bacterium]|nr:recombination regulator RecX [Gammaproteobacteria bacterium]